MDYIQLTPENLEKEYLCCADCPYTAKYVPPIERSAKDAGIPFKSILLENREQAQNAPAACWRSRTRILRRHFLCLRLWIWSG